MSGPPEGPYGWEPPANPKSRAPLFIGLAIVTIVVLLLIGLVVFMGSPPGNQADRTPLRDLPVGQCFNGERADTSVVFEVEIVACTEPHQGELAGTFEYPGSSSTVAYPGRQVMGAYAQEECVSEFARYVGIEHHRSTLGLTFVYPLEPDWTLGEYSIQCVVHPPAGAGAHERVVSRVAPLEVPPQSAFGF